MAYVNTKQYIVSMVLVNGAGVRIERTVPITARNRSEAGDRVRRGAVAPSTTIESLTVRG